MKSYEVLKKHKLACMRIFPGDIIVIGNFSALIIYKNDLNYRSIEIGSINKLPDNFLELKIVKEILVD